MSFIFGKTLGIEINDGCIALGWRSGKALCGFTRMDAPVTDGAVTDPERLGWMIQDYAATNRTGKPVMLTVKTSRAVTRLAAMPAPRGRWAWLKTPEPINAAELFPIEPAGYVTDYRPIGNETALVCCMPTEISDSLAGLMKSVGLLPLCITTYHDSVGAALARTGKNTACVMDDCLIIAGDGIVKEIVPLAGPRMPELVRAGLREAVPDVGYDLTGDCFAGDLFASLGIPAEHADQLAVRGLLLA